MFSYNMKLSMISTFPTCQATSDGTFSGDGVLTGVLVTAQPFATCGTCVRRCSCSLQLQHGSYGCASKAIRTEVEAF